MHHALLIGRYHIYSSKLNKTLPNIQIFLQIFLKCQEVEKFFAYKTNTFKNITENGVVSNELCASLIISNF